MVHQLPPPMWTIHCIHISQTQKTNLTSLYNSHVHVATTPKMPHNIKCWHYARCSTYAENYARLIGTGLGSVCVQLSVLHPLSLSFFFISPPVVKTAFLPNPPTLSLLSLTSLSLLLPPSLFLRSPHSLIPSSSSPSPSQW